MAPKRTATYYNILQHTATLRTTFRVYLTARQQPFFFSELVRFCCMNEEEAAVCCSVLQCVAVCCSSARQRRWPHSWPKCRVYQKINNSLSVCLSIWQESVPSTKVWYSLRVYTSTGGTAVRMGSPTHSLSLSLYVRAPHCWLPGHPTEQTCPRVGLPRERAALIPHSLPFTLVVFPGYPLLFAWASRRADVSTRGAAQVLPPLSFSLYLSLILANAYVCRCIYT